MPRPSTTKRTPAQEKKHQASLAKRRDRRRDKQTMKLAMKAASEEAEGEVDFATLVEAEQERIGQIDMQRKKAGSKSPAAVTTARDNLTRAFDLMGGVAALVVWGRNNATEFYRLWARLIPRETVEASVSLPLEDLLAKLNGREGQTVAEACMGVGMEILEEARSKTTLESLYKPSPDEIN